MPIRLIDGAGDTKYREGIGTGNSTGDPYRGTSLLVDDTLVDDGNPLPVTDAGLSTVQGAIVTALGATNEGAAGSDTATSGLNGLLKRLLARFTTLLADIQSRPLGTTAAPVVTRGQARVFRLTPTVTAGGAGYARYSCIGTLFEIPSAVAAAGRTAILHSVQVYVRDTASISDVSFLRLIIFDAEPTASTFTDGATINIQPADDDKVAAVINIDVGNSLDATTLSANHATNAPMPKAVAPVTGTSLWGAWQQAGSTTAILFDGTTNLRATLISYDD